MLPTRDGSFRLFRFSGIDVFLHWSWFLVAAYIVTSRVGNYSSPVWNAVEYLALFVIVLMHEFGHSLACRSVGGHSDQIVLWPLGGVAYVAPPQRPGAQLWSIAAGPLVNVALIPVFYVLVRVAEARGLAMSNPDLFECLVTVQWINIVLLVFNLLPIYPLDGGQILRSVLWYIMGPINSVLVAAGIGFVGGAGLVVLGLSRGSIFLALIAGFLLFNCVQAFRFALAARAQLAAQRHEPPGPPPL
jgi:Zn-dependent protease